MKIPELLSPVGSMEHLKIAVLSGASSVYLSGTSYGARKFADNFTLEDISKAVRYAHLHNVNVYITVNTLIKEGELLNCLKYVFELYTLGVDGVLVQDIGLMKLIHECIPELKIHASTQMNIENMNDLKWAKRNGISRVVLPRELTLDELKEITKQAHNLDMEVELFVHGAQCFSYSGRCLFSSFIGGRSGNRGTCAQPCRQSYDIIVDNSKNRYYKINKSGNKNYFLSPRDLSLYNRLDILTEIGVDCLKIEGRMRNKEYVMITTSTYRQALNKLRRKSKNKEFTTQQGNENLCLAFNRKLSTGHLFNNKTSNKLMNPQKPGHVGLFVGEVEDYEEKTGKIHIKLDDKLLDIPQKGDGLVIEGEPLKDKDKIRTYGFDISGDPSFKKSKVYWKKNRLIKDKVEGRVLTVRKVRENKKPHIKIEPGCKVYLSKRNNFNKSLKELNNDLDKQGFRKSVVHIKFYVNNGNYPIIKGTAKLGNDKLIRVKHKGSEAWETAKNKPINEETIEKQICKIGDLPYYLESVEVSRISKNLFTPISNLNQLRREFFNELEEEILKTYTPKRKDIENAKIKIHEYENLTFEEGRDNVKNNQLSVYVNDLDVLKSLDDNLFNRVYFEIPTKNSNLTDERDELDISYCVNIIKESNEISEKRDYDFIWMWPNIIHKNMLNDLVKVCGILAKVSYVPMIMTSHPGMGDYLFKKYNVEVYGSYPLNISNIESIKLLNDFKLVTISPELGKEDYKNIFLKYVEDTPLLEVLVHGNIESLVSRKDVLSHKMINEIKKLDNPNNPIGNVYLSDKNKNKYPLYRPLSEEGVVMLNYQDLSLINEISFLKSIGVSDFSIDARWKSLDYVNSVGKVYNLAINMDSVPTDCVDVLKKYSPKFTYGNFIRGLE